MAGQLVAAVTPATRRDVFDGPTASLRLFRVQRLVVADGGVRTLEMLASHAELTEAAGRHLLFTPGGGLHEPLRQALDGVDVLVIDQPLATVSATASAIRPWVLVY